MMERENREEGEGRDHAQLQEVSGLFVWVFILAQRCSKSGLTIFRFMSLSAALRMQWML